MGGLDLVERWRKRARDLDGEGARELRRAALELEADLHYSRGVVMLVDLPHEKPTPELLAAVDAWYAKHRSHHRGICLACNRPIVAPTAPIVVGDLAYDDREPEVRDACPECGAATALTVPWADAPCAECGYGS